MSLNIILYIKKLFKNSPEVFCGKTMYSDVIPKSFSKSSPEENVGRRLRPARGYTSLSFLEALQRGPFRGP
tara:strand:- start:1222 stop:1434 length:213 start_codon:yes stop_codon:yes gene_type:complete